MQIKEIQADQLEPEGFLKEKIKEISEVVGKGIAISALSGGVDSSTVTMLGHRALGEQLKVYFIDNGLMRKDEPNYIVSTFKTLGITVERINAKEKFFNS